MLSSVAEQTYTSVEHLVVVDGAECQDSVLNGLEECSTLKREPLLLTLPVRTGKNGWLGHRIYAAIPCLLDSDFVCFLDQDNWFEPTHIESLISLVLASGCQAAYALRRIHDQSGAFICNDDCQSLGPLECSYDNPNERHIDTNCWLLPTRVAVDLARHWLRPLTGDRSFGAAVMSHCPMLRCTGCYTVNYTAGSRWQSASVDYFLEGNAVMRRRYPGGFPWAAASNHCARQ
jgi:hypothetical protein